jgi:hypothetical protein
MAHQSRDLAVHVGTRDAGLTHDIYGAVAVSLAFTADAAERALIIDAKDGSTTTIAFRSPMRPEEVDGLPAPVPGDV